MHRAGYGPHTRVFDGRRSSTTSQLARAGLTVAEGATPRPEDLVIVVQAPGRVERVTALFHQLGALVVSQAQRGLERAPASQQDPLVPEVRLPLPIDEALGSDL